MVPGTEWYEYFPFSAIHSIFPLIRLMIPPLLGNAASFAPDVPIPVLPLGEFISTASTQDLELIADQPAIHVDDDGWLILSSGLIVR